MAAGLLMELEDRNCWSIAEAVGHSGPHWLQHLLSRAAWDEQQLLDTAAAWAVSHLPEACAADEEHRDLAGVPEEVVFATKSQLAGDLLDRAHERGIRAALVTGDEVYGGRDLRQAIRALGMGYVLAVRANHALALGSGRTVTAAGAIRLIPCAAPGSGCACCAAPSSGHLAGTMPTASTGRNGGGATSTESARPTGAGMPTQMPHRDYNELQLLVCHEHREVPDM
jgi:SRSO17 transposase